MLTEVYYIENNHKIKLTKLKCSDYGFECDFSVEGDTEKILEEFGLHTENEHGIDYPKEALMQFILRKTS